MIYLAVLLVLTGLLILLVALFSESGRGHSVRSADLNENSYSGVSPAGKFDPEDIDIIIPDTTVRPVSVAEDEDIFISFDEGEEVTPDKSKSEMSENWSINETEFEDFIPDSGPISEMRDTGKQVKEGYFAVPEEPVRYSGDDASVYAVLFDDRSNLIDYDSGTGSIGESVAAYKGIKRIGRGKVQVDDDGVSFYMDDKFFRFDFHKVYDVWSGTGFIALPLKGGNSVKLFMVEGVSDFPDRVEVYFQEYIKGL